VIAVERQAQDGHLAAGCVSTDDGRKEVAARLVDPDDRAPVG
jgi:hypothetical protein